MASSTSDVEIHKNMKRYYRSRVQLNQNLTSLIFRQKLFTDDAPFATAQTFCTFCDCSNN